MSTTVNSNNIDINAKEKVSLATVKRHIEQIVSPDTREQALADLSRCREGIPDLALHLWGSLGVVAVLLQEVVSVYPLLSPPTLTSQASTRVCNALALMQCIASHETTRGPFLKGIT